MEIILDKGQDISIWAKINLIIRELKIPSFHYKKIKKHGENECFQLRNALR